jgi:hypothetical protein
MQASLKGGDEEEGRLAQKVASAINMAHEPLRNITYWDAY